MAVGCIGMSVDEFCRCYFDEFEAIYHAWAEMREGDTRDSWERTRTLAAINIQPHVRKKITPRQLLQLPWDNVYKGRRGEAPQSLSREELRARAEEVARRLGDTLAD